MCMQVVYVFFGKFQRIRLTNNQRYLFFRQDFMVIPFQACEVYLDNVVPADSTSHCFVD